MLQRKMANSNYQPPNTAELELARKLRLNEIQMEAVLKEIITYILFLMVIFFLSYQQRDPVSFQYAENLKSIFLPGFKSVSIKHLSSYVSCFNLTKTPFDSVTARYDLKCDNRFIFRIYLINNLNSDKSRINLIGLK